MSAIDPAFAVNGPEWQIGGVAGTPAPAPAPSQGTQGASGSSFGDLLGSSIQSLTDSQEQAAQAAQDLATGQAADPTSVVMSVERAQLAMQMASQIRTKAVEAAQTLFQTAV